MALIVELIKSQQKK
ncbi:MAG: hypothetical protein L0I63_08975 [Lactococcus sp.]|nr:hypothetical protein [Lactococcus sp.]